MGMLKAVWSSSNLSLKTIVLMYSCHVSFHCYYVWRRCK